MKSNRIARAQPGCQVTPFPVVHAKNTRSDGMEKANKHQRVIDIHYYYRRWLLPSSPWDISVLVASSVELQDHD